jgi:hypothetical protein
MLSAIHFNQRFFSNSRGIRRRPQNYTGAPRNFFYQKY